MQSLRDIFEVGPLWTTLMAYGLGYVLSKKRLVGWQIGIAVLLLTHSFSDDADLLGQVWTGGYIAGLLSQKIGIWHGISGVMKMIRERLMGFSQGQSGGGQATPQPQSSNSYSAPHPEQRKEESDQYQKDFEAREKERFRKYQEQRRAQREAERAAQQAQAKANSKASKSTSQSQTKSKQQSHSQQRKQSSTKSTSQRSNQSQQKQQQKKSKPKPKPKPSSSKFQTWYEILGVSPTATEKEIKKARNNLMQRYHPDKVKSNPDLSPKEAEEKTQKINGAFDEGMRKYRR